MSNYEYESEPVTERMTAEAMDATMERGANIARELLDHDRPVHELELQYDVSLPSVATTLKQFNTQLQIVDELHMPVPCLNRKDTPIPVGWLPADRVRISGWTPKGVSDATAHFRSNYDIVDASTDGARNFFRRWLGGFIAAGVGSRAQAGLLVRVVTRAHSLRIHYTTTLLFTPNLVFGTTLSTPVDGYLPPGMYMFGVQGTSDPAPRFDNGVFSIPPTTQATLVIA